MSTCATPACGEQHGLVDGVCSDCDLVARVLLNERVLSRVQEAREVLKRHGLLGGCVTPDLATRDFGVPSRTHVVAPNTAEFAGFWDDPCWTRSSTQRHEEATAVAESVQPACPTCGGRGYVECGVRWEATFVPCPNRTCPDGARFRSYEVPRRCEHDAACDGMSRFCTPAGGKGTEYVQSTARYVYRWRQWTDVRATADRCNAFWDALARVRAGYMNPQREKSVELGCTCVWVSRGSIITFDPYCPALALHRGVPAEFTPEALDRLVAHRKRQEAR